MPLFLLAPTRANATEFVTNGGFSQGLSGWTTIVGGPCGIRTASLIGADGPYASVVEMNSAGAVGCDGTSALYQDLNIAVSSYSSLTLSAVVKTVSADVRNGCGDSGTEYPVQLVITYVDSANVTRTLLFGFYFGGGTCGSPFPSDPTATFQTMKVAQSQWIPFNSPNLKSWIANGSRITRVTASASGWDYAGRVDNISLSSADLPAGLALGAPGVTAPWIYWSGLAQQYKAPVAGIFQATTEGLQFFGDGIRGGAAISTVDAFNVSNTSVYMRWKADGAGSFMHVAPFFMIPRPGQIGLFSRPADPSQVWQATGDSDGFTTDHSSGGSTLISNNTWYYTRTTFSGATMSSVTSVGNYDDAGGRPIESNTRTVSASNQAVHLMLAAWDFFSGSAASVMLGEARIASPSTIPPGTSGLAVGTASGRAGSSVLVPVTLSNGASGGPSAVQFDLTFDHNALTFNSALPGDALTAAGKTINTSAIAGGVRVLGAGLNQNLIGSGTVAQLSFTLSGAFPPNGTAQLVCSGGLGSTPQGQQSVISCANGLIRVGCGCDINGDGATSIADVQLIINQALGITGSTCGAQPTISDVQIVINAALGLGCTR